MYHINKVLKEKNFSREYNVCVLSHNLCWTPQYRPTVLTSYLKRIRSSYSKQSIGIVSVVTLSVNSGQLLSNRCQERTMDVSALLRYRFVVFIIVVLCNCCDSRDDDDREDYDIEEDYQGAVKVRKHFSTFPYGILL